MTAASGPSAPAGAASIPAAAIHDVRPLAPRPVFCVTAHERRDPRVAEDVCDGRFDFAGVARRLGIAPDWLASDLPADDEWRIEWSKFYYGRDLAHAFALTGEARFLRARESLVGSWLERRA